MVGMSSIVGECCYGEEKVWADMDHRVWSDFAAGGLSFIGCMRQSSWETRRRGCWYDDSVR